MIAAHPDRHAMADAICSALSTTGTLLILPTARMNPCGGLMMAR